MTRSRRTAAVSALVMSLGLSGAALLAVAPLTASAPADAATRLIVAANPSEIPGCDPGAGPCEEPTPVVTVTVTDNPEDTPPPTTPVPQKTVTTTVTVPPATKSPKPPKPPKSTAPAATSAPPVPLPKTAAPIDPPPVVPTQTPESEEPEVVFPPNTEQSSTPPSATPSASGDSTYEDVSPESAPYEIRNAGSEFDGATLSSQLAVPALILVLLVMFAVLIFEGRLRRLAHAAAIRRAGPRGPAHHRGDTMGYPAGPGYGPAPGLPHSPYQGGTAYAPIISFVPMQMYAPVYPEGYAPEQYPQAYEQQTAYPPQPGYGQPPVGYEQYGWPGAAHEPMFYGQPGSDGVPTAPPYDPGIPDQEGRHQELHDPVDSPAGSEDAVPQGPGEFPGAPFPQEPPFVRAHSGEPFPPGPDRPADRPRSADSEGVPSEPTREGDLFLPPGHKLQHGASPQGPGEFPGAPFPLEPPHTGDPGPGLLPGQGSIAGPTLSESTGTAVYPLPGQDSGKKKRGLFRRSK